MRLMELGQTTRASLETDWWLVAVASLLAAVFFLADHRFVASRRPAPVTGEYLKELSRRVRRGMARRRAAFIALLAVPVLCLARGGSVAPRTQTALLTVFLSQVIWYHLTLLWAADLGLAVRRIVPWSVTCLAAFMLSGLATLRACVGLLAACSLAFLAAGLATEVGRGAFLSHRRYRFAGTLHANQQGVNCAVLLISSIYMYRDGGAAAYIVLAVIACAAMLLTRSRGAVWAAAAAVSIQLLWEGGLYATAAGLGAANGHGTWSLLRPALAASAVVACVLAALAAVYHRRLSRALLSLLLLGRRSSYTAMLTGRVPLWGDLIRSVGMRLFVGTGYGCLWEGERIRSIARSRKWNFSDSHSVYVETLLSTGVPGLLLFVALPALVALKGLSSPGPDGGFILSFAVFVLIQGVVESTFALPNFFTFAFLLVVGSIVHSA